MIDFIFIVAVVVQVLGKNPKDLFWLDLVIVLGW